MIVFCFAGFAGFAGRRAFFGAGGTASSSSSSFARFFPFPLGAFVATFFSAGALLTLPLAEALALVAPFVEVEVAFSLKRGFFVAGPVKLAALRFDARRGGSGASAVAVAVVEEEAPGVMTAELE